MQNDTSPSRRKVLVFGASGYIGTNLVPRLLRESSVVVRAAARSRRVLEARGWAGAELVEADALRPETLVPALDGVDTAYYLVHSMSAGRGFGALDLAAARHFAAAAATAGVRCIVYLGGLVPEGADSEHIVSRRDTGDVLREGPVPVIELRAGIIVGPGSAAFEVMRDLVLNLPMMVTPRWVQAKSPPIALDNLLEYLVRLPSVPEAQGRIFDAGGPEVITYAEMMKRLAVAAGQRRPWIIPVPVLTPTLSSYWLRLVTAVPTPIARALIGGLKHDFHANDAELRRLVPQRLLDFDESVEAVFEAERRHEVQARWTEGAFPMRGYRVEHAYYAKRASGTAETDAPPEAAWKVVEAIGGGNRYYCSGWLWWLRELLDWTIGGPGRNRGRRDPETLRVGDHVDSWHVIGLEPGRRLTLMMGMKAPGAGVLEFEVEPRPSGGARVTATAYWHPAGVWGLAYWYTLVPAHLFIFRCMTSSICRRAEGR
ncbi:MAG: SDR family oxidoreductase [Steroidobacteraceae bacterium]|jgi:uncharacterized protein YbjT (DUF2867 family)|nr:SDR family oxidoreductase [Steroidobacteraceae bacterium]